MQQNYYLGRPILPSEPGKAPLAIPTPRAGSQQPVSRLTLLSNKVQTAALFTKKEYSEGYTSSSYQAQCQTDLVSLLTLLYDCLLASDKWLGGVVCSIGPCGGGCYFLYYFARERVSNRPNCDAMLTCTTHHKTLQVNDSRLIQAPLPVRLAQVRPSMRSTCRLRRDSNG